MGKMLEYKITVDFDNEANSIVKINEGSDSAYLSITVQKGGKNFDISDKTVRAYIRLVNKSIVFKDCVINTDEENNTTCTLDLDKNILSGPGVIAITFVVTDSDGSEARTNTYHLKIGDTVVDEEAVISSDEFSALTEALLKVNNLSSATSPLMANTIADMVDTNRCYVYCGSEEGYTAGYLYYWNGTNWTKGWSYQATQTNAANVFMADGTTAEATVNQLKEDLVNLSDKKINYETEIEDTAFYVNTNENILKSSSTTQYNTYVYNIENYKKLYISLDTADRTQVQKSELSHALFSTTNTIDSNVVLEKELTTMGKVNYRDEIVYVPEGSKYVFIVCDKTGIKPIIKTELSLDKKINMKSANPSTIIIAAYNSAQKDKKSADIICDGKNDEVEIQQAIDSFKESGRIKLCNGNYNIDSLYDTGNEELGKFGIYISNPTNNHHIEIVGVSHPNRVGISNIGNSPVIRLSENVYDSLTDTEKVTLFGALPADTDKLTKKYPYLNLTVKNLGFMIPGNKKSITLFDGQYLSNLNINFILCSISDLKTFQEETDRYSFTPNENCIGLRLLQGMNFGTGYEVKNCFIWGMNVAYDVSGEHLIMENCGCRMCNYSFRFNGYGNEVNTSHPSTLINCCEEACKSSMYFCTSTRNQAIDIIDYNIEYRPSEWKGKFDRTTKAVEETPGSFRGKITFSANKEDYKNADDIAFWENGSGLYMETVNLNHKLAGTTAERKKYAPNLWQKFFDTDLNKLVIYNGTKWVDVNGIEVDIE